MKKAKRALLTAVVVGATITQTGCSGINASRSISPATFLLPGLVENEVKPPALEAGQTQPARVALLSDQEN